MHPHSSSHIPTKTHFLVFIFMLSCVGILQVQGQMVSVVNSLADDSRAHPYDDPTTLDIDESIDGICGDSLGRCTLRAALEEASWMGVSAQVTFSVSGLIDMDPLEGPFIPPDDSWIQGYGQQVTLFGDEMNTPVLLELNNGTLVTGLDLTNGLHGIAVYGNHNRIGLDLPGLANSISGMLQSGIIVTGDSNVITGNWIGLDLLGWPDGSAFGVFVVGKDNVIGGIGPGEGNIISANDLGVAIYTIDSVGYNIVVGNSIGTDTSGSLALGNRVGIEVIGPNVFIGGPEDAYANVICGNTESGVLLGIDASDVLIGRNRIGVAKNGATLIPNRDGIVLGPGSHGCTVRDNLVRGNGQFGLFISGMADSALASANHLVHGNVIDSNGVAGIAINGNVTDNVIGSSLQETYSSNLLTHNGGAGILISALLGTPQRNTIRQNHFRDNANIGIRILAGQGGIQPPELVSYTDDGQGLTTIVGVHALAGATIDLYRGAQNQANAQEGAEWIGSSIVDVDGNFTMTLPFCACDSVVATATDVLGNTSEFSNGWGLATGTYDLASPVRHALAFPNPFVSVVTIEFELAEPGEVLMEIRDTHGGLVYSGKRSCPRGIQQMDWNPSGSVTPGVYSYRLSDRQGNSESGLVAYLGYD